jgi:hypothetical protein
VNKGVKVVLCKRVSGAGSILWLEFIDTNANPSYVPQYDVTNLSDQEIKTLYTKLQFPNGVAIEFMNSWSSRKALKEDIPPQVEEMMKRKGLTSEYEILVDQIAEAHKGDFSKLQLEKINEIVHTYSPKFESKGVSLFVSHKEEYYSYGQYGTNQETYRWLEFVDRDVQPNYHPQRNADSKPEDKCSIQ